MRMQPPVLETFRGEKIIARVYKIELVNKKSELISKCRHNTNSDEKIHTEHPRSLEWFPAQSAKTVEYVNYINAEE